MVTNTTGANAVGTGMVLQPLLLVLPTLTASGSVWQLASIPLTGRLRKWWELPTSFAHDIRFSKDTLIMLTFGATISPTAKHRCYCFLNQKIYCFCPLQGIT